MEQINQNYTSIINRISRDLGIIASYDKDLNALKDFQSEHQKIRKRVTDLFDLAFKSIDKNEIETADDIVSLTSYQNIYCVYSFEPTIKYRHFYRNDLPIIESLRSLFELLCDLHFIETHRNLNSKIQIQLAKSYEQMAHCFLTIYYDGFDKSATIREQVVPVVRNFIQSAKAKYTLVDESPFA